MININPGDTWSTVLAANPAETTFVIKSGVHREQGFDLDSDHNGRTFIFENGAIANGSRVFSSWTVSGSQWYCTGVNRTVEKIETTSGFEVYDEGVIRAGWNIRVWIDDVEQEPVTSQGAATSGKFYFDDTADRVYVGTNPSGKTIEVAWKQYAFNTQSSDPCEDVVILGYGAVVEKYATGKQNGAIMFQHAIDCTIEGITCQQNIWKGISGGPGNILRNCITNQNGQMGMSITGDGGWIIGCEVNDNNVNHWFNRFWEAGGAKYVRCQNLRVQSNVYRNNGGPGLWVDIDNINIVLEDNICTGNDRSGIYHEISFRCVIRRNFCADNYQGGDGLSANGAINSQIRIGNSMDTYIYDNICIAPTPTSEESGCIGLIQTNRGAIEDSALSALYGGTYLTLRCVVRNNYCYYRGVGNSGGWASSDADRDAFWANGSTYSNKWLGNKWYRPSGASWNHLVYANSAPISWASWQAKGFDSTASGAIDDNSGVSIPSEPALSIVGSPRYSDIIREIPDLISYFPLNEPSGTAAIDYSLSGGNGTYVNTPTLGATGIGDENTAVSFDRASSERVDCYSAAFGTAFNADEFTVSFWFKPGTNFWTDGVAHNLFQIGNNGANCIMHIKKTTTNNQLQFQLRRTNVTKTHTESSVSHTGWIHVMMIHSLSGNYFRAYINNVQEDNNAITGLSGSSTIDSLYKIGTNNVNNEYSTATIGHVAVYKRALDSTERTALYQYNQAPVVVVPSDQSDTEGESITLNMSVTDNNSANTHTYTASGLPTGLSINSSTGQITGTLSSSAAGDWYPYITVTDNGTPNKSTVVPMYWTVADGADVLILDGVAASGGVGDLTLLEGNVNLSFDPVSATGGVGDMSLAAGNVDLTFDSVASSGGVGDLTLLEGNVNLSFDSIPATGGVGDLTFDIGGVTLSFDSIPATGGVGDLTLTVQAGLIAFEGAAPSGGVGPLTILGGFTPPDGGGKEEERRLKWLGLLLDLPSMAQN